MTLVQRGAIEPHDDGDDGGQGVTIEAVPADTRRDSVYATTYTVHEHQRRPVIPAALHSAAERRALARHVAGRAAHTTAFHAVRLPVYIPRTAGYVVRGGWRVVRRTSGWAFDREHAPARAEAIRTLNLPEARAQYRQRQQRVRWRGGVYWTGVGMLTATVAAAVVTLPRSAWWAVGAVLAVLLAVVGRPLDRPAYTPAVVKAQYRRLTPELVESAVLAAGLAKLNREGNHALRWVQPCQRDGRGWLAVVDLPPGVTVQQAMDARAQLASGLHVSADTVFVERDRASERRLRLWVADQPMSEVTMPAWPLLKAGRVDLFAAWPFGLTARGATAAMVLMFTGLLVGAIPRMGKTFATRLAALAAALDPTCELHVVDLKGGGDWIMFEQVAHVLIVGDQAAELEAVMADLGSLRREMQRRYLVLREMARAKDPRAPEAKVTRELADDTTMRLHPIVLAIDEVQVIFAKSCQWADEAEEIVTDLVKRGPAVGVVVIVATQKPDRDSLPTGVRDNVGTRFGMRVLTQQASDMVLGGGMSVAGYRAHAFGRGDRGVGYLVGATDDVDAEVVNAFYVDTPQAEQIVARARAMREHAGTVTGHAAGVESARRTSLLEDVAGAMQADREHCDQLATRLAAAFPEQYAGWDGPRLAGALRGQGVTVRQVKVDRVNRTGVHRGDVDRALAARDT